MKLLIILPVLAVAVFIFRPTAALPMVQCPAGYYENGKDQTTGAPLCHREPTGCPYGDNIPLGPECDKQAPAPQKPMSQNVITEDKPVDTVYNSDFVGK